MVDSGPALLGHFYTGANTPTNPSRSSFLVPLSSFLFPKPY